MRLLSSALERVQALLFRHRLDAEMDEELRFHLEMEVEKNLRTGMGAEDANRRAMIAFGGVERFRERTREERGLRPMEDLGADLRFALRTLRKTPGFTAVALLSLGLGIGANTAVFSVVNAILLRDLPFHAPRELVNVYRDRARGSFDPVSFPDFRAVQEATGDIFSSLGGFQYGLTQREGEEGVEPLVVEMVTGGYFPLLGIKAALGRVLLPEDDNAPGAHPVVVLGYRYWREAFGASQDVVGQSLRLGGRSYTVVGVAPPEFPGSRRGVAPHLFAPLSMIGDLMPLGGDPLESRGWNAFFPVGRLRSSASLLQLRATLAGVSADLHETVPEAWPTGDSLLAVPTGDVVFDPATDRMVVSANVLAMSLVGLVLLVACANLASFLLARALDRRREVALRLALGATRGRLLRQFLTETLVLGVLAGVMSVPLALWFLRLGMALTLSSPLPVALDLSFDRVVLGFTTVVALAAGILVGLLPALRGTRPEVSPTLKDSVPGGDGPGILAVSRMLVAGQTAVAVVLLVAAGLFLRSFEATRDIDPGFGREPTALLSFMVPSPAYSQEEGRGLLESLEEEARGMPGVSRVGMISNIHLNTVNAMILDVNVDGAPPPGGRSAHPVDFTSVDGDFFGAAGISLLEGRLFDQGDRADQRPVAIVNEAMARRFWADESPLGRTVRVEVPGFRDLTVVGVVSTAKIHSLGEAPTPFLYLPYAQEYNAWVSLLAVTREDPAGTARRLYRLARERYPQLVVTASTTLEEHIGILLLLRRLSAVLSGVLAAIALGLAVMGLYGVVGYAVARRSREMGIRMSLGAEPRSLVALQLRKGLGLVVVGGMLGLVVARGAAQAVAGFLFGVSAWDPPTYLGAAVLLAVAASLAAYFPARRASRVDPVHALRQD